MQEIAQVYARSLFEVAQEHDLVDRFHDEIGEFAEAIAESRELQLFFFSPYFSSQEKKEGIAKVLSGADERFARFLELLAERHRMPAIQRIRSEYDRMWAEENQLIEVSITTAVDLDKKTVNSIGKQIEKQTGRKAELNATTDPDVLGGLVLRVGNMVLDASVRARLEKLRKTVARAA